jgi:hypothetical protein
LLHALSILFIKFTLNKKYISSLPDSTAESGGKYPDIINFTGKNHVEQYIRKLGIPNATFAYLSFYSQNIGTFLPFISNENGEIELVIPYFEENDQILLVDVNDTGVRIYLFIYLFIYFIYY